MVSMIAPKVARPTPRQEREAYELATTRDQDTCQRCLGWCGASQRDHRKNRSQGGLTVASNLMILGETCHRWKTEHPADAVHDGWAVPGFADPAEWPTRRWFRTELGTSRAGWALLDDAGGVHAITDADASRRMEGGGGCPGTTGRG